MALPVSRYGPPEELNTRMAVPWPTHRVKAQQNKARRRALRRRDSKLAKAAHLAERRRAVAAP